MATLQQNEVSADAAAQAISEVNGTNQFVTFTCGRRAFGIDIMSVREIRSWTPTTPMPNQPHGAQGVLDIRGKIVEVFDLATLLGTELNEEQQGKVVLVVSLGERDLGITLDAVSDIIFAASGQMRPAPTINAAGAAAVTALVKVDERLIAILNLESLFPTYAYD
jgi:purine-binding chemotaxis protein CheW